MYEDPYSPFWSSYFVDFVLEYSGLYRLEIPQQSSEILSWLDQKNFLNGSNRFIDPKGSSDSPESDGFAGINESAEALDAVEVSSSVQSAEDLKAGDLVFFVRERETGESDQQDRSNSSNEPDNSDESALSAISPQNIENFKEISDLIAQKKAEILYGFILQDGSIETMIADLNGKAEIRNDLFDFSDVIGLYRPATSDLNPESEISRQYAAVLDKESQDSDSYSSDQENDTDLSPDQNTDDQTDLNSDLPSKDPDEASSESSDTGSDNHPSYELNGDSNQELNSESGIDSNDSNTESNEESGNGSNDDSNPEDQTDNGKTENENADDPNAGSQNGDSQNVENKNEDENNHNGGSQNGNNQESDIPDTEDSAKTDSITDEQGSSSENPSSSSSSLQNEILNNSSKQDSLAENEEEKAAHIQSIKEQIDQLPTIQELNVILSDENSGSLKDQVYDSIKKIMNNYLLLDQTSQKDVTNINQVKSLILKIESIDPDIHFYTKSSKTEDKVIKAEYRSTAFKDDSLQLSIIPLQEYQKQPYIEEAADFFSNENLGSIQNIDLFDISFRNEKSESIEPESEVKITISSLDDKLQSDSDSQLSILHFEESSNHKSNSNKSENKKGTIKLYIEKDWTDPYAPNIPNEVTVKITNEISGILVQEVQLTKKEGWKKTISVPGGVRYKVEESPVEGWSTSKIDVIDHWENVSSFENGQTYAFNPVGTGWYMGTNGTNVIDVSGYSGIIPEEAQWIASNISDNGKNSILKNLSAKKYLNYSKQSTGPNKYYYYLSFDDNNGSKISVQNKEQGNKLTVDNIDESKYTYVMELTNTDQQKYQLWYENNGTYFNVLKKTEDKNVIISDSFQHGKNGSSSTSLTMNINKRIDSLADGIINSDTGQSANPYLTDIYRQYLDISYGTNPINVIFCLDLSASMNLNMNETQTRWEVLKNNLLENNGIIDNILSSNLDNQISIVGFSGNKYNSYFEKISDWSNISSDIKERLNNFSHSPIGATNYDLGLFNAAEMYKVLNDDNKKNQTYIIFMSDGVPTYFLDEDGREDGPGGLMKDKDTLDKFYNPPKWQQSKFAQNIDNWKSTYKDIEIITVAYSDENMSSPIREDIPDVLNSSFLWYMATDQDEGFYTVQDGNELKSFFAGLAGQVKNVSITDTLSQYVTLPDNPQLKIVMNENSDSSQLYSNRDVVLFENNGITESGKEYLKNIDYTGMAKNQSAYSLQSNNLENKEFVTVQFKDTDEDGKEVSFPSGTTFTISFDVYATEAAYQQYAKDLTYNNQKGDKQCHLENFQKELGASKI